MPNSADGIRQRFEALFGALAVADKIAFVTGKHRATVYRWLEHGFPEQPVFILELLESLQKIPRKNWPKRVRDLIITKK